MVFCSVALPAQSQVSITSPAPNSRVSGTVSFTCTNPGGTTGLYIDNAWVANSSFSWNTVLTSNGSHYLICNGYVGGQGIGGTNETVTVANGASPTPILAPTSAPTNAPTSAPTNAPTSAPTNAPTSAPTIVPTSTPTSVPTAAPTATPVGSCPACPSTVSTLTIDVNCTNTPVDNFNVQCAMNCQGFITRPHGTCDIANTGLVGLNIGYEGADAQLSVAGSIGTGLSIETGANQYNALAWKDINLTGGGGTNTNGISLGANFTKIYNPNVTGFTVPLVMANNGYNDDIYSPNFYGVGGGTGFQCSGDLSNAGEGIRFWGGQIYNMGQGFNNAGCQLSFHDTHFDGISSLIGNGPFTGVNMSVEEFSGEPSAGVFFTLSGNNAFNGITYLGGGIAQDSSSNLPIITITNTGINGTDAPYAMFIGTFVRGVGTTTEGNGVAVTADPNLAYCGLVSAPNNNGGYLGDVPKSGICP